MAKQSHSELGYRIAKIQTLKFSFEDIKQEEIDSLFSNPGKLVIRYKVAMEFNSDHNHIVVDILTEFRTAKNMELLVEHIGRTGFFVVGLKQHFDKQKNSYNLPNIFLAQILGMAYTHARALLSVELSPTVYRDKFFLPVIDPSILIPKPQEPQQEPNS